MKVGSRSVWPACRLMACGRGGDNRPDTVAIGFVVALTALFWVAVAVVVARWV